MNVRSRRPTLCALAISSFALLIEACTSTGVVPMDRDTYMIAKRSAQAGFGPPVKAQAAVYREASAFCAKQNKTLVTVKLDAQDSGFARPGSVSLQFKCVAGQ